MDSHRLFSFGREEYHIATQNDRPAAKVPLSIPSLFTATQAIERPAKDQIIRVPLDRIAEFPNHPFHIRDDDKMRELTESISRSGILHPALLLPREDKEGHYYYIAGHRRGLASEKAGLSDIPAIIKDISMDEATILMVDSNLQQRDILPSEKAWAYRMKLDAMRRHAGRPTKNSGQIDQNYQMPTSRDILAEQTGDSSKQVQRYIRLTYLITEFLDLVDNSRMAFGPAVDVSYLSVDHQRNLLDIMGAEMVSPSIEQAASLKKAEQNGDLDFELIHMIMKQQKPNQLSIKLSAEARQRVYSYFPKDATPADIEAGILEALELRKRTLQRKSQQQSR